MECCEGAPISIFGKPPVVGHGIALLAGGNGWKSIVCKLLVVSVYLVMVMACVIFFSAVWEKNRNFAPELSVNKNKNQ